MGRQSSESERRALRRVPVAIDAVIYYNTLMLPECYVRDLSPEGAFIATNGNSLPDQALVDVALNAPGASGVPQRFSARVVRSTEEGAGVRLQNIEPGAMRRLITALYAH